VVIFILYFFAVNVLFILIQNLHSIASSDSKKNKYLIRKTIIFFCHGIILFAYYIYMCVKEFISDIDKYYINFLDIYYYPNSLIWLIYFILFIVISNILYQIIIRQLGKSLKW